MGAWSLFFPMVLCALFAATDTLLFLPVFFARHSPSHSISPNPNHPTYTHSYWQLLHTVMHHTYTNMDNDPDLYHYVFFLRDHANYPYAILHRLQVCVFVCLSEWAWVFEEGRVCV